MNQTTTQEPSFVNVTNQFVKVDFLNGGHHEFCRTEFEEFCSESDITGMKEIDGFNGSHYQTEYDFTFEELCENDRELKAAVKEWYKR